MVINSRECPYASRIFVATSSGFVAMAYPQIPNLPSVLTAFTQRRAACALMCTRSSNPFVSGVKKVIAVGARDGRLRDLPCTPNRRAPIPYAADSFYIKSSLEKPW